jgi:hypothetical protein
MVYVSAVVGGGGAGAGGEEEGLNKVELLESCGGAKVGELRRKARSKEKTERDR